MAPWHRAPYNVYILHTELTLWGYSYYYWMMDVFLGVLDTRIEDFFKPRETQRGKRWMAFASVNGIDMMDC